MAERENTTPDGYEESIMGKYMNTPVNPTHARGPQVAALIVFPEGMTREEVSTVLNQFAGNADVTIREFNPVLGGAPVIYFP